VIIGQGSIESISASQAADEAVTTYIVDTSLGDITITLPSTPTQGKVWNIKKLVNANTITVATAGSETIDGDAEFLINREGGSYPFQYDDTDNYIIL